MKLFGHPKSPRKTCPQTSFWVFQKLSYGVQSSSQLEGVRSLYLWTFRGFVSSLWKVFLPSIQWSTISAFMILLRNPILARKTCPQTGFWVFFPKTKLWRQFWLFKCLTFEGVFSQSKNFQGLYLCLLERFLQDISSSMP